MMALTAAVVKGRTASVLVEAGVGVLDETCGLKPGQRNA